MSVKVLKYSLAIIFFLIITLIVAGQASATCYITKESCSNEEPLSGIQFFSYANEDLNPSDAACDVGTLAEGVAEECQLVCCCHDFTKVGSWETKGFCDSSDYYTSLPRGTAATCSSECANSGLNPAYDFIGYVKLNNVAQEGAKVNMTDANGIVTQKITGANGYFKFEAVPKGSITLFAELGSCNKTHSFELYQANLVQNINLDCNTVSLSGVVTKATIVQTGIKVNVTYGNRKFTTTTDENGEYSFSIPANTALAIEAYDGSFACTYTQDIAIATTNKIQNIELSCEKYNLIVNVYDQDDHVAFPATVTAGANQRDTTSSGIATFTQISKGTYNVIAYKTTPREGGSTTCNSSQAVDLTSDKTISLTLDTCCEKTITYGQCTNGMLTKTIHHSGDCENSPDIVTKETCGFETSCWQCSDDWSSCTGATTQTRTCTHLTENCNDRIPKPATERPCNQECGNGVLQVANGEQCDYGTDFFDWSAQCQGNWSNWANTLHQQGYLDKNAVKGNGTQSIVCNLATCRCNDPIALPGGVTDCSINPGQYTLSISNVTRQKRFNLEWKRNSVCTNIDHYEMRMCEGLECSESTYRTLNANIPAIQTSMPYVYSQAKTQYCFRLTAVYSGTLPEKSRSTTEVCVMSGDAECLVPASSQTKWCKDNALVNCSSNNTVQTQNECTGQTCGFSDGQYRCYVQGNCSFCNNAYGIYSYTSLATDYYSCPSIYEPISSTGCYLDYSKTIIDKVYSCNETKSCYDYYSLETCEQDRCGRFTKDGVNSCEWANYSMPGFTNIFKKGVCRPKAEQQQDCSVCSSSKNRLFYNCTKDTCNLFGNCYFEPKSSKCIPKSLVTCNNYTDAWECLGGQGLDVSTNTSWSITTLTGGKETAVRTGGNNNRTTSSNDAIGLGVCMWTNYQKIVDEYGREKNKNDNTGIYSKCIRNADNLSYVNTNNQNPLDKGQDCKIQTSDPLFLLCQKDTIAPNTTIVNKSGTYGINMDLHDELRIKDNNAWPRGDDKDEMARRSNQSYLKTYFCISKDSALCYPNINVPKSGILNLSLSGVSEADNNNALTLYYFSEDPARNLELIRSFPFKVDSVAPNIILNKTHFSYKYAEYDYRTNVTFRINLSSDDNSKPISCRLNVSVVYGDEASRRFQFIPYNDIYGLPGLANMNNKLTSLQSEIKATYPGLVDGVYKYELLCTDSVGNIHYNTSNFTVNGDMRIYSPVPNFTSGNIFRSDDDHRDGDLFKVDISVNTMNDAVCKYTTDPEKAKQYVNMEEEFSTSDSILHTSEVAVTRLPDSNDMYAYSGIFTYYVGCSITIEGQNYIVYGTDMTNPRFAIDDIPPQTSLTYHKVTDGLDQWKSYDQSSGTLSYLELRLSCNDTNPLLTTPGQSKSSFGCNDESVKYCLDLIGTEENECSDVSSGNYVTKNSLVLDYQDTNSLDKQRYGNNPLLYYYSTDLGNNVQEVSTTRLQVRNVDFDPADVKFIWSDSTTESGAGETIEDAFMTISVEYPQETNVTITDYILISGAQTIALTPSGALSGRNTYAFQSQYYDNGNYKLYLKAVDDDGNERLDEMNFNVKHLNNSVRIIYPKLGIGTSQIYNITVETKFPSTCKYGFDPISISPNDLARFNDPLYNMFDSTGQTIHKINNYAYGPANQMYVICQTSGAINANSNAAFVKTSFPLGYNTTAPDVNITFIQKPQTRWDDNKIINGTYNATIVQVITDQNSVCQINASLGREIISIRLDPATYFSNESAANHSRYYKIHNYTIDYKGTGTPSGLYSYTVNCTSLAQLSTVKGFQINFTPDTPAPVASINVQDTYLNSIVYNITCQGLCMGPFGSTFKYAMVSDSDDCQKQPLSDFVDANYSDPIEISADFIELFGLNKMCVRTTDALQRSAWAEKIVDVRGFNSGDMTINNPYAYSSGLTVNKLYANSSRFTLNISTDGVNSECRYITKARALEQPTNDAIFSHANRFTQTDAAIHTHDFKIDASPNYPEVYAIICLAQNTASPLYITRELFFYWDNTSPYIEVNTTPKVIIDWTERDKVRFNVTTDDDSRCIVNLGASSVEMNDTGAVSTEAVAAGVFSLDYGSDSAFQNYTKNHYKQYSLPYGRLDKLNLTASYNFSVECYNRAKLYNGMYSSVRYDLAKDVVINLTSGTIFNSSQVPIIVKTNVKSSCVAIIDGQTQSPYAMTSADNITHNITKELTAGALEGNHTVDIECRVPQNNEIDGHISYQIKVDSQIPKILSVSTLSGRDYTCSLNAINLSIEMSDDTGIEGYSYNIVPGSTQMQFVTTNGNYAQLSYPGALQENTAYTINVRAKDKSGKVSEPASLTLTARRGSAGIICDDQSPSASIILTNVTFANMVKANVTCTDESGCRPLFNYTFTSASSCSGVEYAQSESFGNALTLSSNGILCVRSADIAGNVGYAQKVVNITADTTNNMNIMPAGSNIIFISPNVISTAANPFNLTVTTNTNANCKIGRTFIMNETRLSALYANAAYSAFNVTGTGIHYIPAFNMNSAYETYIDVICQSTADAASYSRKVLRIVYGASNPSISMTAYPEAITDINDAKSLITVRTNVDTWCSMTSIGSSVDSKNMPFNSGASANALSYKTLHERPLDYAYTNDHIIRVFTYDAQCYSFNNSMYNKTNVTIIYNITDDLDISLISESVQKNRTASVMLETNLIGTCRLRWDGLDKGFMIENVTGKQHFMSITTSQDKTYIAIANCTTPDGILATKSFNITVNTTLPPARCNDGVVNRQDEECDLKDLDGRTCTKGDWEEDKYEGGILKCTSSCKYDFSQCDTGAGYCGNGKVEGPNSNKEMEMCDGKVPSGLSCKDLGFKGGDLRCDNCMLNSSGCTMQSGTLSGRSPSCSNNIFENGELCSRNRSISLTCESFGYDSGSLSCLTSNCMFDLSKCKMDSDSSSGSAYCGNGKREGSEKCDKTDLNGMSCSRLNYTTAGATKSYAGGTLGCYSNCTFNVTRCTVSNASNNTACSNGLKDYGESDIDCGAGCTVKCALNKTCTKDLDCSSGKCSSGKCIINTCNNTRFDNATETDIDCGKTCSGCSIGKRCSSSGDCTSGLCDNGKCANDPCNNGVLDDGEADVDCGGECGLCGSGSSCTLDDDCESGNCKRGECSDDTSNPAKLPLLMFSLVSILGAGGYIGYKTFLDKKPVNSGFTSFGSQPLTQSAPTIPQLTPEQRAELMKRQKEVMAKKRQSRMSERKGLLGKLDDQNSKDDDAKDTKGIFAPKTRSKDDDGDFVELSRLSKNNEEYVDLGKLKEKKDSESKKTFDKLKTISAKTDEQNAPAHSDDVTRKLSEVLGKSDESIRPIVSSEKISNSEAMKLFADLGKDTIMSKAFVDVLSRLLKSKKITNDNVSNILFEYLDKGLLTKSDVAKISSELKII